ncbi:MAG TPA: sugar phosphate isomerase/epimerase [Phototrophicaceae bacterium]|nr:sugar phosphate isomerase/epimerase [Phototrophicaceae bacterium]
MKTRTGSFPIGLRRGGSAWQTDLSALIAWAKESGLEVLDLGRDGDKAGQAVIDAGLRLGSVDLPDWEGLIAADKGQRAESVARNAAYVEACAALGTVNHFIVMLPQNPALPRSENFGYMVESFNQLAPSFEQANARLIIEGWPGPGALCCTPEGYRAFFRECVSPALGVNYDPSHLIRMGIDPLRFLREFVGRVYHVHGKDTELFSENLYEYGHEQPPTFALEMPYGSLTWRYTIPGHGVAGWTQICSLLQSANYAGALSIELEDMHFNGTEAGEQFGILQGARFLEGC